MQKRLLFLILCCLSANVNAQQVDTVALIRQVLSYYTEPVFLNNLQCGYLDTAKTERVIFYADHYSYNQTTAYVFIWNIATQTLEEQIFNTQKWAKMSEKSIMKPLYVDVIPTDSLVIIRGAEWSTFKWVKKREAATDTLVWCLVEVHPQIHRIVMQNEKGETVSSPAPIEIVHDARFKYNPKTQKYEMQPFERSAERRSWFAQTYLLKPKK